MTPQEQIRHGFQVIAHLVWFTYPLIAFTWASQEIDNDGIWLGIIGVIAQATLAVGYIYGWNIK